MSYKRAAQIEKQYRDLINGKKEIKTAVLSTDSIVFPNGTTDTCSSYTPYYPCTASENMFWRKDSTTGDS